MRGKCPMKNLWKRNQDHPYEAKWWWATTRTSRHRLKCGLLFIPYTNNELDWHALLSAFLNFIWSAKRVSWQLYDLSSKSLKLYNIWGICLPSLMMVAYWQKYTTQKSSYAWYLLIAGYRHSSIMFIVILFHFRWHGYISTVLAHAHVI